MKQNGSEKLPSFSLRSEMKRNGSEKLPSFSLRSEMKRNGSEFFRFDAKKVFSHLKRNENEMKQKQNKKDAKRKIFGSKTKRK